MADHDAISAYRRNVHARAYTGDTWKPENPSSSPLEEKRLSKRAAETTFCLLASKLGQHQHPH
jgi:hypothetical protein